MNAEFKTQKELGEYLEGLREDASLSQEEMAHTLGTSQSAISRVENGGRGLALEELEGYSRYFGVPVDEILGTEQEGWVLLRGDKDSPGAQQAVELFREVIGDYFGAEALAW